eukprot:tig00000655_g2862.t1
MAATREQYDVIVVGGGFAGLAAALEASDAGASVAILEKEPKTGGNSAKASSGMNSVGTAAQEKRNIPDTKELFTEDTIKSGDGLSDPELVRILAENAKGAIEWLNKMGQNETLKMNDVVLCGGHAVPRTHRSEADPSGKPAPNIGFEIVSTLAKRVKERAQLIDTITGAHVVGLLRDDSGAVVGVEFHQHPAPPAPGAPAQAPASGEHSGPVLKLKAKAVVLAAGGYAADRAGLLAKYTPDKAKLATTNGAWATGDGVKLAERIGADLIHMDKVQVHPTGLVDPADPTAGTKFLGPEALRGVGGILINHEGKRFVNELGRRDNVTSAIFAHCKPLAVSAPKAAGGTEPPVVAYLVLSDDGKARYGAGAINFYASKKLFISYPNAKAFAEGAGLPAEALEKALAEYSAAAESGAADAFGRKDRAAAPRPDQPLHVAIMTPSLHYTMGGVRMSPKTELLAGGKPIPGLYGAGEVTGGVHGENRLAGNSLLECCVFGRIAGREAAARAKL